MGIETGRVEDRPEKSEKDKYIIVEVGSGDVPYIADSALSNAYIDRFKADPSIQYIGVDDREDELKSGREWFRQRDASVRGGLRETGRVHYVVGSGTQLPFSDDAVSEIIYKNVFGDPEINQHDLQMMTSEAARVLKKGGVAKIVEQYTPDVAIARTPRGRSRLEYFANNAMFEPVHDASEVGFTDETEIDQRMTEHNDDEDYSFVVRFRKR